MWKLDRLTYEAGDCCGLQRIGLEETVAGILIGRYTLGV